MKDNSTETVSIIGGSDGPTSIFIAGRSGKCPLKVRIKNHIYKCKRKRAEKKIVAGTHTLEAVVAYAIDNYNVIEVNAQQTNYVEQKRSLKESLILQHKPELLGEMKDISNPDFSNEESIREFFCLLQKRSEMMNEISDSEIPMDFHLYEVKIGDSSLEIAIDYIWNILGISYSGSKKEMKQLRRIAQDLYTYYGVSEDDIREKTERYSSLIAALIS